MRLSKADDGIIRDRGELSLLQDLTGTARGRFPAYRATAMNWREFSTLLFLALFGTSKRRRCAPLDG